MTLIPSAVLETSTLNKWLKTKIDLLSRNSTLLSGLMANGRVSYGSKNSGKNLKWRPKIKRRTITAADPYNVQIEFPSRNMRMEAALSWVTYNLGEKVTKLDKLANRGSDVQYANLVQEVIDGIAEDFMVDFATKLYVDGGGTTSKDLMGFESMFSVSGTVSNSYVGNPNDTYAGKSTALGGLGGDWDGSPNGWPAGSGDTEYCAWSPMVWDYTNTRWVTTDGLTSASWKQVVFPLLNAATAYMGRLHKTGFDTCLINTDLLRQAKDSLRANERVVLTPKSKLVDLGFKTISYDGLEIADDYDVPDLTGYLFSWENIELHSMQDQLVAYERDKKIETSDDLYSADFYGQMRFESPALFGKIYPVTTGT